MNHVLVKHVFVEDLVTQKEANIVLAISNLVTVLEVVAIEIIVVRILINLTVKIDEQERHEPDETRVHS